MLESVIYFRGVPKTDIIAAFDYYIKNLNDGRPFILAGHSQGSIMILEILASYMKANPEVYRRMIAAYAIGDPLGKNIMPDIPMLSLPRILRGFRCSYML
jgi:hypothetical protein